MCMTTAAVISAGASVLGTGVSMAGQLQGGEARAQQALMSANLQSTQQIAEAQAMEYRAQMQAYQAQVARNNAQIARQLADYQVAVGSREAEMKSLETAAQVGQVAVTQAARGVAVSSPTAVNVRAGVRGAGKIDVETIMSNRLLQAYGYRTRATEFEAQANLEEAQGALYRYGADVSRRSADYLRGAGAYAAGEIRTGAALGALGTLISGASGLPFKWSSGGDFTGTAEGLATYGSPGYAGSLAYGGPR